MFDLNSGELFVALFILTAIVSAPLWPAVGERIAIKIWQGRSSKREDRS